MLSLVTAASGPQEERVVNDLVRRIDGHVHNINANQQQSTREIDAMKGNRGENHGDVEAMQAVVFKRQQTMIGTQLKVRRLDGATNGRCVNTRNANTDIGELRDTFASLHIVLNAHARRLGDLEEKQASWGSQQSTRHCVSTPTRCRFFR
ncbi:MAG: hypothetical protein EB084_23675 [Proteobacteria bacterium]|nr:hypothetical protein [Pseudomonadota bacterium]